MVTCEVYGYGRQYLRAIFREDDYKVLYVMLYITCMQSNKAIGKSSSMAPMSFENRFRIRPNNKTFALNSDWLFIFLKTFSTR